MVTTRFIRDDVLWREILACAGKPDRKLAAVAYMATESASLLPLQRGERLVVDMSLDTVKRGSTDPRAHAARWGLPAVEITLSAGRVQGSAAGEYKG